MTRRAALLLAFALGFGANACADPSSDQQCPLGVEGCPCFNGDVCLKGLSCLSGLCVDFGGETGDPGDGDGDPSGDGDGDPSGDGDGDPSGDGDGDPSGDGDPCEGSPTTMLFAQGSPQPTDAGYLTGTFSDLSGKAVELADDFSVSDSCWCIDRVVANGFYKDQVAPPQVPKVFVEFFDNGPTVPVAAPSWTYYQDPVVAELGSFDVHLEEPAVLVAGTHWLSFRPELDQNQATWYWRLAQQSSGSMAAFRDKDTVLFGGVCMGWTPSLGCVDSPPPNGAARETQFQLWGRAGQCN